MKVSYNWLKELVKINLPPKQLADEMSLHSIEVEEDYPLVKATGLVIGHVLTRRSHENSDHLSVCSVDLGDKVEQIVCGAPNVAAGQKVIVATVGAVLPAVEIKKSVIRGVESNGMICSLAELGIEHKYIPEQFQNGIYVLEEDAPVGMNALKYLGYDDHIIELGITPNRMDLLSMRGVAYDINAMYGLGINDIKYDLNEIKENTSSIIDVEINTSDCYSYYARAVKDVVIKDSPLFIKSRLIAAGIRPINNVVDITNYVLMLFGQPLHAFDKDTLGNKIIVRNAKQNETTVTLDDIERKLVESDLVITDNKEEDGRIVCLGGVMGCANTEVTNQTKNLILESAVFKPLTIRRTSSRLGLRSESSIRFERGVDINTSLEAVNYACYLLEKYADAKVLKGYVHQGQENIEDRKFELDEQYIKQYLGIDISLNEIEKIMKLLSFKTTMKGETVVVLVPNRRLDITIKEDLVEEIARIYGYDSLKETLPLMNTNGELTKEQKINRELKHLLSSLGMDEVITYSLVNQDEANQFRTLIPEDAKDIKLLYPMTEDHSVLRKSLIPSLVDIASYNNARKINDLAMFEIGKRYYLMGEKNIEETLISGFLNGKLSSTTWKGQNEIVDFYFVKGLIDEISNKIGVKITYKSLKENIEGLHPYRTAGIYLGNKLIGFFGALHPEYIKNHDIVGGYVFELLLDEMITINVPIIKYQAISKVPAVERDLALLINNDQPLGEIIEAIKHVDKQMISKVEIFDIFSDEKLGDDLKSVAFRITLEPNETLTEDVITQKINKILKTLEYRFKITLRG